MLSFERARQEILDDLQPLSAESVELLTALGGVLAAEVRATRALPAFDNSSMDGYAVRAADTVGASESAPVRLSLVGTLAAGHVTDTTVGPGTAVRIFTGAPLPAGADSVVVQERTRCEADAVLVSAPAALGENVRRRGSDVGAGDLVLVPGQALGPGDLAMLAAQGRSFVEVHRKPRVAILPTGDELVEIDETPRPGQIPNSNSLLLAAQVLAAGGVPLRLPVCRDDPALLARALGRAAEAADLVVTCGGVSVGEHDFVRSVTKQLGRVHFWQVAIKPGKPLAYGRIGGTPLVGLPGNPGSAFVCFALFVTPALRKLAGCREPSVAPQLARLMSPVHGDAKRRSFLRGRLARTHAELVVDPVAKQGSGELSSLVQVNALIALEPGTGFVEAGNLVTVVQLGCDMDQAIVTEG